ncbi:SUMF1/EgtB/PvdO family nonheme iron enzyme [bacterium]|nr:SUMF1/EgtB/PvdO family nonheme iron enzyme [bacterium]
MKRKRLFRFILVCYFLLSIASCAKQEDDSQGKERVPAADVEMVEHPQITIPLHPRKDASPLILIKLPPGPFSMGSDKGGSEERPIHPVTISRAFYLAKYETTNAQFAAFLNANGNQDSGGHPCFNQDDADAQIYLKNGAWRVEEGKGNYPAVEVTWYGAQAFCEWAGQKVDSIHGWLPTEAEWEYACRAGTQTEFFWGNLSQIDAYAWYRHNANGQSHAVGLKQPNPWGLHDICGNVWEWCLDQYSNTYYEKSPSVDPVNLSDASIPDRVSLNDGTYPYADTPGIYRILRGGSFTYYANSCRSASRDRYRPETPDKTIGFRMGGTDATP